jgi:hypothetical protein
MLDAADKRQQASQVLRLLIVLLVIVKRKEMKSYNPYGFKVTVICIDGHLRPTSL